MTKSKHSYLLHIEGKYKIVRNIRQTSRTTCLLLKTDYCPLLRALYNLKSGISSIHKYDASPLNMIVLWPLLLLCVILWFYILADLVPVFTASQLLIAYFTQRRLDYCGDVLIVTHIVLKYQRVDVKVQKGYCHPHLSPQ